MDTLPMRQTKTTPSQVGDITVLQDLILSNAHICFPRHKLYDVTTYAISDPHKHISIVIEGAGPVDVDMEQAGMFESPKYRAVLVYLKDRVLARGPFCSSVEEAMEKFLLALAMVVKTDEGCKGMKEVMKLGEGEVDKSLLGKSGAKPSMAGMSVEEVHKAFERRILP